MGNPAKLTSHALRFSNLTLPIWARDAWLDDKRLFTLRGSFQNLYAYSFTQVQASMSMQSGDGTDDL